MVGSHHPLKLKRSSIIGLAREYKKESLQNEIRVHTSMSALEVFV